MGFDPTWLRQVNMTSGHASQNHFNHCSYVQWVYLKSASHRVFIYFMLMTLAVVMPHTDINPNTNLNPNCAIINFKNMMWCTFHVDPLQLGFGIVSY